MWILDVYTGQHFAPGTRGSPHIIGGSDLLIHNRGKNSDLDEWLKDVVEVPLSLLHFLWSVSAWIHDFRLCFPQEERQSRRDENIGDDLFR